MEYRQLPHGEKVSTIGIGARYFECRAHEPLSGVPSKRDCNYGDEALWRRAAS